MTSRAFKTAILIPVYNKLDYTRKCLESVISLISDQGLSSNYDIVVIDDGSTDGTGEWIKSEFHNVHVLKGDGNLWWSGCINKGAEYARDYLKSDYLLLWNNDIQCDKSYFSYLVELEHHLEENEIIGSKIFMDESLNRVWSMGGMFNKKTGAIYMIGYDQPDQVQFNFIREINWLPGMGTLIPISAINKIGFWDNVNFPQYHGDLEYTYRAYLNGYRLKIDTNLRLSNDTRNSSLAHEASFKKLFNLLKDRRSLYNFRVNTVFIKKYGVGPFRYYHLLKMYSILILSFFKHFLKAKIGLI